MLNSTKHQLYLTDCVTGVKSLPDNFLDLVLSGPPYFDVVKYSDDKKNLSTKDYTAFLKSIHNLWRNIEPKLKNGGMVALWLHDIYVRRVTEPNQHNQSGSQSPRFELTPGRESQVPRPDLKQSIFELKLFHADIIKTMPKEIILRNILIWDRYLKKIHPDLPNGEQFGTRFQYILFFSKGKTAFEERLKKLYWSPIWYFKTAPKFLSSKLMYYPIFWIGKIPLVYRIVNPFLVKTKRFFIQDKYAFKEYLTTCPPEVAEMIIKNFSRPGDTVCDPFLGSGTTMKAANDLNRKCIGFEINQEAKGVILNKVGANNIEIFD